MLVKICVGSSCHITGSQEIVTLMQKAVSDAHLNDQITLAGSFCSGKCNREGVTVTVDDVEYTGVTARNFNTFFNDNILSKL